MILTTGAGRVPSALHCEGSIASRVQTVPSRSTTAARDPTPLAFPTTSASLKVRDVPARAQTKEPPTKAMKIERRAAIPFIENHSNALFIHQLHRYSEAMRKRDPGFFATATFALE